MKVQSIYTSKILKKGLKFAAENGTLFGATASLAFSAVRPLVILATPDAEKNNKQIASTKAIASTLIGYAMMVGVSMPVSKAVKKIDSSPAKYLKHSTIEHLQAGKDSLSASSKYAFSTQLFKLGLGAFTAIPKSILTCALIPPILHYLFKNSKKNQEQIPQNKDKKLAFTGGAKASGIIETLAQKFGKVIDSKSVRNIADKFHNTKFEQHIISLTDIVATGAFVAQAGHNKKIDNNEKKLLIYNSLISTGLSIGGMYLLDDLTKKPTEKFIENFKKANAGSKDLNKYLEGIKIAKPLLILGTIYYTVIPLVATFLADKLVKPKHQSQ